MIYRQGHQWEQPSDVITEESHSSDMSGSDGPGWLEQLKLYSTPWREAVTASKDGHAASHMQFPHSASPKSIIIFLL